MNKQELLFLVQDIVSQAMKLKNIHTDEINAPVNYACIFSQNQKEYLDLLSISDEVFKLIEKMPNGSLYEIASLNTCAGVLRVLKIRQTDITRPERGDADFTVQNYDSFKNMYLNKSGFSIIDRPGQEMIELVDSKFNVRAYFSKDPLDKALGLI